jgi:CubicO group peptidase (beta-lactamase class C family)
MTPDTVFRLFSMTKAVGSVAAMILIERGQLSIDTQVADILPEFGALQRLVGFDGNIPRYAPPTTPVTVRHLAVHTSGLVYDTWNASMPRWLKATGNPPIITGLKASLNCPLMFEPGERWGYGIGTDWLGRLVETIDGRGIDRFCSEEILEPLDMSDTAFEPGPRLTERLCAVHQRTREGGFVNSLAILTP